MLHPESMQNILMRQDVFGCLIILSCQDVNGFGTHLYTLSVSRLFAALSILHPDDATMANCYPNTAIPSLPSSWAWLLRMRSCVLRSSPFLPLSMPPSPYIRGYEMRSNHIRIHTACLIYTHRNKVIMFRSKVCELISIASMLCRLC